ncbi:Ankyrin repeat-containing protein [Sphingomonas gellani]|uniref:Ankyrin repeat-containing protein n=1 Tax=Sphingomonas gellani TaxID=1166340 RepID=A0A1H8HGB4_9SPHN|nr:ankyrin repeat domain-containing protein [Sphingomonas gellani]SEN55145.1 Ankyrin repeat-containing protein [Sphingomonas gellani]
MSYRFLSALILMGIAVPATAQFQSESRKFLQAVREAKGNDVLEMLNKPGQTMVNTRDGDSGETALHIVVKRGDLPYTNTLLMKGANPNAVDFKGNTPLLLAVEAGQTTLVPLLVEKGANPNLGNRAGETPLIRAVQRRDVAMVRALLAVGADPDKTDNLAGRSARDYAGKDLRNPVISTLLAETPKKATKAVSGPRL